MREREREREIVYLFKVLILLFERTALAAFTIDPAVKSFVICASVPEQRESESE